MFNLLSSSVEPDGLDVAYLIVAVMLGIAIVVGFIAQIMIVVGYLKGNRRHNAAGITGAEAARRLLEQNGMPDVAVKKCGFWRMLVFGNHYSISKRTIFLRKMIIDKDSITSVGIAAQKVGLAMQHRDGNKKFIVRSRLQALGVFAPILFIPVVLIGFVLDLVVFHSAVPILLAVILGVIFVVLGFVTTVLNIPVEKAGIENAKAMLSASGYLDAEELAVISKVYRAYMIEYVTQFVIALLRIIEFILRVLVSSRKSN